MKKRAIHTAASYDEFKNLVACATQKPIESGALVAFGEAKVTRNVVAGHASTAAAVPGSLPRGDDVPALLRKDSLSAVPVPNNMHEFTRDWRRHCKTTQQRYEYIARLDPARLARVFKGELDSELLSQIVQCFVATISGVDAAAGGGDGDGGRESGVSGVVLAALSAFSGTARFELTLDMLSKAEKANVLQLFTALRAAVPAHADIDAVAAKYGV